MKKLLVGALSMVVVMTSYSQHLNIATYNIRYANEGNAKEDAWSKRLPHVAEMITKADLDIFGIQEGLFYQLADLLRVLTDYEYCGLGRNGGRESEHSAIWYKRDKFTLIRSGNFWLSPTPDTISKGWDAALTRICTWGEFIERKTGYHFYFFNTHFDHRGAQARKNSIDVIFQHIEKIAGKQPVILTGDFNMDVKDPAFTEFAKYKAFKNAHDIAVDLKDANTSTFNAFDTVYRPNERIDHIFLSGDFKVNSYRLGKDRYDGIKLPSDHYPVMLQIAVNKSGTTPGPRKVSKKRQ